MSSWPQVAASDCVTRISKKEYYKMMKDDDSLGKGVLYCVYEEGWGESA